MCNSAIWPTPRGNSPATPIRILPGDGDLPLPAIIDRLRAIDYQGFVSVEAHESTAMASPTAGVW